MNVLLTFVGIRDPRWRPPKAQEEVMGPILSLVSKRRFDRIILFSNPGTADQAQATRGDLCASPYGYPESDVPIKELPLKDPTDYVAILIGLREHLQEIIRTGAADNYFIAGSSGTPQMQACSMLLTMSGIIDAKFLLIREPQFEGPPIREFDFSQPQFPVVTFWSREVEAESMPESELMTKAGQVGIIGEHPELKKALRQAERYARYDLDVLVVGEKGTGKELFAEFIRQLSRRKDKRFRVFSGGNIPDDIADSELFGHEKGAFTGATARKIGLFEAANEGILFVDEVGKLSPKIQSKLHRAVEYKSIVRVGWTGEPIKVDVRLIFATNADLWKMVEEGKFLADLLDRIYRGPVKIPPLRERRSDIPKLALHFLGEFSRKQGIGWTLTDRAMTELQHYSWPGNIRELKNVVEGSCAEAGGTIIDVNDLKIDRAERHYHQLPILPDPYEGFLLVKLLKDVRRHYMQKALKLAGGNNKSEAARLLGITPGAFHKYWKEHARDFDQS